MHAKVHLDNFFLHDAQAPRTLAFAASHSFVYRELTGRVSIVIVTRQSITRWYVNRLKEKGPWESASHMRLKDLAECHDKLHKQQQETGTLVCTEEVGRGKKKQLI